MTLNHSMLHWYVMDYIVTHGFAPTASIIADAFDTNTDTVKQALQALEEYHGVVLDSDTSEILAMHPFSDKPTNFWVTTKAGQWWGNCAWCSLGAAWLLQQRTGDDVTIVTTLGGDAEKVFIDIVDGEISNKDLYVHFPVPMTKAWENVIYTCSTMLVFDSEAAIDNWCQKNNLAKGDVQPIDNIWAFSKVWYGKHLDNDWTKWRVDQASEIFKQFGLTHSVWDLPVEQSGRF